MYVSSYRQSVFPCYSVFSTFFIIEKLIENLFFSPSDAADYNSFLQLK
jgi:hypothetical protein